MDLSKHCPHRRCPSVSRQIFALAKIGYFEIETFEYYSIIDIEFYELRE